MKVRFPMDLSRPEDADVEIDGSDFYRPRSGNRRKAGRFSVRHRETGS